MSKWRKRWTDLSSEIPLKIGQVLLFALMILGILSLIFWSIYSSQPHQVEKLSILNESNDAASLAYSQRESFNVALAIESWYHGDGSYRDLQITRALLGQRLQVLTQDNVTTYSLMTQRYRNSLAALDQVIMKGRDLSVNQRHALIHQAEKDLNTFLTETRRLSRTVQLSSFKAVNKVVQSRTRSELYQSFILFFTSIVGFIFFLWVSRDLIVRFKNTRKMIEEEKKKLVEATRAIEISRKLDEIQNDLLGRPVENWRHGEFLKELARYTEDLVPEAGLEVRESDNPRREVDLLVADANEIGNTELAMIRKRVDEISQIHRSRRRLHEEAIYRANHDALTGLLNSTGLISNLEESAIPSKTGVLAAIFIDVDRFHRINDSLGFKYGDSILITIANKLKELSGPNDLLARINSDEYVVVTPVEDEHDGRLRALELQAGLEFTAHSQDIEMEITVSAGLVLTDTENIRKIDLMHDGAIATSLAGRQIRSGFASFTEALSHEFVDSLSQEFALKQALRNNEFVLYLQPVIGLQDGTIEGAETLIRWNRPGHGLVYPDEFLPTIREYGLVDELGAWVMNTAMQIRANSYIFQSEFNIERFKIGVNVEAEELINPEFYERYRAAFQRTGVNPQDFVLEVTEHAFTEGEIAIEQLSRVRDLGALIAIDDFGTGYSNLAQAQNLPLSILKIDKSFIPKGQLDSKEKQLVVDIKQIADTLQLASLAEGVETPDAEEFVKGLGVTYAQGYLYSPAVPEREFWNWVRRRVNP